MLPDSKTKNISFIVIIFSDSNTKLLTQKIFESKNLRKDIVLIFKFSFILFYFFFINGHFVHLFDIFRVHDLKQCYIFRHHFFSSFDS